MKLSKRDVRLLEDDDNYIEVPRAGKTGQIISYLECNAAVLGDEWPGLIRDASWNQRRLIVALDALIQGDDVFDASECFWRPNDEIEDHIVERFMSFPDTRKRMDKLNS